MQLHALAFDGRWYPVEIVDGPRIVSIAGEVGRSVRIHAEVTDDEIVRGSDLFDAILAAYPRLEIGGEAPRRGPIAMPCRHRGSAAERAAAAVILARTGLEVPPRAAAVLVCAECGEPLRKLARHWSCPAGHGKLVPTSILLTWLRAVGQLAAGDDVRLLRRVQRSQPKKAPDEPAPE